MNIQRGFVRFLELLRVTVSAAAQPIWTLFQSLVLTASALDVMNQGFTTASTTTAAGGTAANTTIAQIGPNANALTPVSDNTTGLYDIRLFVTQKTAFAAGRLFSWIVSNENSQTVMSEVFELGAGIGTGWQIAKERLILPKQWVIGVTNIDALANTEQAVVSLNLIRRMVD